MKVFMSVFLVAFGLMLFSCSVNDDVVLAEEELNATSFRGPVINVPTPGECDGFDIFPNEQFDCGWKRGYTDYVYHYNSIVSDDGLAACDRIRLGSRTVIDAFGRKKIEIIYRSVDNSPTIINRVKNLYRPYYDALAGRQFNSDFDRGQFAGYLAGLDQVPYAANGDCQ